jgi:hypothetical protein
VAEHHFLQLVYRMPAKPPTGRVAPNADEAQTWLRRCESLLKEFEAKVFELHDGDERSSPDSPARGAHLRALPAPAEQESA